MECKLPLQRVLDWRNTSRDFKKNAEDLPNVWLVRGYVAPKEPANECSSSAILFHHIHCQRSLTLSEGSVIQGPCDPNIDPFRLLAGRGSYGGYEL